MQEGSQPQQALEIHGAYVSYTHASRVVGTDKRNVWGRVDTDIP